MPYPAPATNKALNPPSIGTFGLQLWANRGEDAKTIKTIIDKANCTFFSIKNRFFSLINKLKAVKS